MSVTWEDRAIETWGRFARSSFQSESVRLTLECSVIQERVPIALFPALLPECKCPHVCYNLALPLLYLSMKQSAVRVVGWSRDAIFDAMSFAGARGHGGSVAGAAQAALRPLPARDSGLGAHKPGGLAPATADHHALGA